MSESNQFTFFDPFSPIGEPAGVNNGTFNDYSDDPFSVSFFGSSGAVNETAPTTSVSSTNALSIEPAPDVTFSSDLPFEERKPFSSMPPPLPKKDAVSQPPEDTGKTPEVPENNAKTVETPHETVSTQEVSTKPLITKEVISKPLNTQATTNSQTTSEVTTKSLTSRDVSTKPLTTQAVTKPLTAQVTAKPLATQDVTTKPLTTQAVTTEPPTSSEVTKPLTTRDVATKPLTIRPTQAVTATVKPQSTPEVAGEVATVEEVKISAVIPPPLPKKDGTLRNASFQPETAVVPPPLPKKDSSLSSVSFQTPSPVNQSVPPASPRKINNVSVAAAPTKQPQVSAVSNTARPLPKKSLAVSNPELPSVSQPPPQLNQHVLHKSSSVPSVHHANDLPSGPPPPLPPKNVQNIPSEVQQTTRPRRSSVGSTADDIADSRQTRSSSVASPADVTSSQTGRPIGWAKDKIRLVGPIQYGNKSAFLKVKEGILGTFNKRWFVLEGHLLKIFNFQDDAIPKKIFDLAMFDIQPFPELSKYCVHLGNEHMHFYFKGKTQAESDDWILALGQFTKNKNTAHEKAFLPPPRKEMAAVPVIKRPVESAVIKRPVESNESAPPTKSLPPPTKNLPSKLPRPPAQPKPAPNSGTPAAELVGSTISVEVLSTSLNDAKKRDFFTSYEILVCFKSPRVAGGRQQMWNVFRRFAQFHELYVKITHAGIKITYVLPDKTQEKNFHPDNVEARRAELNECAKEMISHSDRIFADKRLTYHFATFIAPVKIGDVKGENFVMPFSFEEGL
eukprot:TRINITY_DN9218_c0_g1_i1.p1 TRINITY_DN9218_c0_g1~~TRINITY_DN9218_c0_g1_i1.p1  ORF type:complete len:787 (+),score=159.38 TRINITY_DN9218_c0_g1_i1:52-2412(+)